MLQRAATGTQPADDAARTGDGRRIDAAAVAARDALAHARTGMADGLCRLEEARQRRARVAGIEIPPVDDGLAAFEHYKELTEREGITCMRCAD